MHIDRVIRFRGFRGDELERPVLSANALERLFTYPVRQVMHQILYFHLSHFKLAIEPVLVSEPRLLILPDLPFGESLLLDPHPLLLEQSHLGRMELSVQGGG
jgi:hypothetical protein